MGLKFLLKCLQLNKSVKYTYIFGEGTKIPLLFNFPQNTNPLLISPQDKTPHATYDSSSLSLAKPPPSLSLSRARNLLFPFHDTFHQNPWRPERAIRRGSESSVNRKHNMSNPKKKWRQRLQLNKRMMIGPVVTRFSKRSYQNLYIFFSRDSYPLAIGELWCSIIQVSWQKNGFQASWLICIQFGSICLILGFEFFILGFNDTVVVGICETNQRKLMDSRDNGVN